MKYLKLFENFNGSSLMFEAALLLKIDEKTKDDIKNLFATSTEAKGLFPLPDDKLHITLTSIKNCKDNKVVLKNNLPTDIVAPQIVLGETTIAQRPEAGKTSFVVAIQNQDEFLSFVDEIYTRMGLTNPESGRYFHITIANNVENKKSPGMADSFGSIGDVTQNDFM